MFGSATREAQRSGQALVSGATKVKVTRGEHHRLVDELSHFDVFAHCSRDDLDALVDAGKPFTLPANWALINEGDAAVSFYAITHGEARVFHGRAKVAEIGPGEVIGEMALLTGSPRQATVTSTSRLEGLRVGNDSVIDLFSHHPKLLEALHGVYDTHAAADMDIDV